MSLEVNGNNEPKKVETTQSSLEQNNPEKTDSKPKNNSIFYLEDDKKGEVGYNSFEISDIRGHLEFYTKQILRSKLAQFIGKEFSKVQDSVQRVLDSILTPAGELKDTVDKNKLKDKQGNINKEELVAALKTIEQQTIEKGQSYEVFLTAVDDLLNETFGLLDDKSWKGANQHVYLLQNNAKIAYTHNKHITIEINGERFSYNMNGEEIATPRDNEYVLNVEKNVEKTPEEIKKEEQRQAKIKENRAKCPILPQNVKSKVSMQGLKKDWSGTPSYTFTDSTGRELVFGDRGVWYDTELEFNDKQQLVHKSRSIGGTVDFKYDDKGNVIEIIEQDRWKKEAWSTTKEYDNKNRVVRETFGSPGRKGEGNYTTVTYSYDKDGNCTEKAFESDKNGNPIK